MFCSKCGFDMGQKIECPICGSSIESITQEKNINNEQENNIVIEENVKKISKKLIIFSSMAIVFLGFGLICLLKGYQMTSHIWYENQYNEIYRDDVRIAEDRNSIIAVGQNGLLIKEFNQVYQSDLDGVKEEVVFEDAENISQALISNNNEYTAFLVGEGDTQKLYISKENNIVRESQVKVQQLLTITNTGLIYYLDDSQQLVCQNDKESKILGENVTKFIVFEEDETYVLLQSDNKMIQGNFGVMDDESNSQEDVTNIGVNNYNSWKTDVLENDKIVFSYLKDSLEINSVENNDSMSDDNYKYVVNDGQLIRIDLIDNEEVALYKNIIDFGIDGDEGK